MSSTRKCADSAIFSQERYSSSNEFEDGLLANLVARRVALLDNAADREIILYLQAMSHMPGGLRSFSQRLLADHQDQIGTPAMHALRAKRVTICNECENRQINSEIRSFKYQLGIEADLLKGPGANPFSNPVPLKKYFDICIDSARIEALDDLRNLCLNPDSKLTAGSFWYFPAFREVMLMLLEKCEAEAGKRLVMTETTRRVWDTLEYARDGQCMVLIDGLARIGKTFSAKCWCEARPGRARYVQVPSTNDDLTFFRSIAKALGVGSGLSMKGQQMRERVELTLQESKIMVVFDEAHYCWPQNNRREALPVRLNWIMTALVNHGVPVGLITTPQFAAQQKIVEKKTGWASEQFIGRLSHYEKLPDILKESDLQAVAKMQLPEGNEAMIDAVVGFAKTSAKYLSGIDHAVKRARFLACSRGRKLVSAAELVEALKGSAMQSIMAEKTALSGARPETDARALPPILKETIRVADSSGEVFSRGGIAKRVQTAHSRLPGDVVLAK